MNVDTVNGTVTLKGAVESQAQVDRAVQVARAAEGVKAVSNQLTLKTKPRGIKLPDLSLTGKPTVALHDPAQRQHDNAS